MAKVTRLQREINEKQKRPGYVCLARDLCLDPPIKHRHTSARRMYLTPFEFGVAMAAVAAATTQWWNDEVHRPARAASGETIKRRSQYIKAGRGKGRRKTPPPFSESEWELTHLIRSGYVPDGKARFPVKSGLKLVGSSAYRRNRAKLMMKAPPATVMVERSPRALLVSVGLPSIGRNHRKLEAGLNRLRKPVAGHPPVLESWERLKDGRLRLQVCGAWFPRRAYARLPLPLPLHSATALALYLFLNGV